jgi:hypothetical protein
MSYSFSATANRAGLHKALGDEVAKVEQTDQRVADERNDHLVAALVVVDRLAEAVGRPEDDIAVSVSGHANPDHAPAEGWADEAISITVAARPVTDTKEQPDG